MTTMAIVDEHGLQRALQNPLPPDLYFVSGQWHSFGPDAILVPCQGLSGSEIMQVVCSKAGVADCFARVPLLEKRLIVCIHVSLGDGELNRLVQLPSILYGLRLVLANRLPVTTRCVSVSPRYIDVRLTDDQMMALLRERTQAPERLISYLLRGFAARDVDELVYMASCLKPTYEKLLAVDPNNALSALKHYITKLQCRVSLPDAQPQASAEVTLNRISMLILVASFLASYNPVASDLAVFHSEKRKRGRKKSEARAGTGKGSAVKIAQVQLGPRDFALDRMLAILSNISDKQAMCSDVYTQISNLVAMKLLEISGSSRNAGRSILDATRLKCLIDLHAAENFAEKIGLRLSHYLYDPHS